MRTLFTAIAAVPIRSVSVPGVLIRAGDRVFLATPPGQPDAATAPLWDVLCRPHVDANPLAFKIPRTAFRDIQARVRGYNDGPTGGISFAADGDDVIIRIPNGDPTKPAASLVVMDRVSFAAACAGIGFKPVD